VRLVHLREHGTEREDPRVTESTREPGWYPDPWGTEKQRYFDGSAWARDTRPGDGVEAGPGGSESSGWPAPVVGGSGPTAGAPTPAPAAVAPSVPVAPVAPVAADPAPVPAGWHADPWGVGAVRWWDGRQWTGHVSGPPATADKPVNATAERALARWLRPTLILAAVSSAASQVSSVDQIQWIADHWDRLMSGKTTTSQLPTPAGGIVGAVAQTSTIFGVAAVVLFLMWFYRAATNGWAAGLPARRSPTMATVSFIIPILNLWWPLQSTLDMVPADTPNRNLIRWWWVFWLLAGLCGLAGVPVAFAYGRTALQVVLGIGAGAIIVAGVLASAMVEYVTRIHERVGAVDATA
jgi:hypothetical protein